MAQPVQFHSADRTLRFSNKTGLKQFIDQLFALEKKSLSVIHYVFCSDEYLLQMNKDFLKHDYYTDIITFDLSEKDQPILGEVYISLDRVKDNATQHAATIERETLRVIFHGALHLCGYKDKKKDDIVLMRKKEDYYINHYMKGWIAGICTLLFTRFSTHFSDCSLLVIPVNSHLKHIQSTLFSAVVMHVPRET